MLNILLSCVSVRLAASSNTDACMCSMRYLMVLCILIDDASYPVIMY